MASVTNKSAQTLRALLQRKGQPLILTNVYDRLSAQAVAELPQTEALATASYAIAQAAGLQDEALDFETNLAAVRGIAAVARHKVEVDKLVKGFDGRLNVMLKRSPDGLSVKQLADMGVARISVGPALQFVAMGALKREAEAILLEAR
ncbi:Phosphoenolpyruvate/pyruvate domain-containing protein [Apiospora saccharicola]